ncbi:hypothetical protein J2W22_001507 [Sphingomonas kyeonggiensis]|uniref:hypothetical protein n=1 Tax=Sphingomonas kyeonggiensis TaxID=1268553 RepID=UPI002783F3A9|nr:hypothetical protein [Sphingomonas kyeonggiensis]MDQ0249460.1 hypothetical protein [Sphingomonas kyeonggiensis]
MIRNWKGLAMLAGVPMLAAAAPAGGGTMPVYPLPDTMWPDPAAPIGKVLTLKPGEELMRASVKQTQKLTLLAPVKVSIDKFTDEIATGEELTAVIAPPETQERVGGKGLYFCGRDQRGRSGLGAALLGGIGARFMPIVRFCFIDGDKDGKLDQVFLAGAKDKALQKAISIEPVAYKIEYLVPRDAGQYLRLRYRKHIPESNKVQLELEVYDGGKKQSFDYVLYDGFGGPLQREYAYLLTNPKKVPYPAFFNNVMGAIVRVDGVDADGNARFVVERNFRPTLFRPVSIQVQYIYIYI